MSEVAVILGSESDMPIAERVVKVLEREGVSYERIESDFSTQAA